MFALVLVTVAAPALAQSPASSADTFVHVAPILHESCAPCHRPGGIGPFSLLTHADVAKYLSPIRAAVASGVMPPWKPEPGHGDFADERRLPEPQKARLLRWLDAGAPAGNLAEVPPAPRFADGWQLGQPDLVITMPEAFDLAATGPDVFRNFVLPVPVIAAGRRLVRAWEFRPGNNQAVHHATIGLDATRSSRELDEQDPAPGYAGVTPFSVSNPDGYFLGWSPGQRQPQSAIDRMPWRLEPGADLMFSMHLRPTGRPERVQASIGLYFTDTAPAASPVSLRLGRQDIDIPAGSSAYTIANEYRLPVDVALHSVYPHAHHLARRMEAWAVRPDGGRMPLLLIADWDFDWQDVYRYREPVPLPAGTVLHMQYTYDNSGHRQHGGGPPRRVTFGPNSSDEMGDLWLQVVPALPRQRGVLVRDFERKLLPETIAGLEMMVAHDPENAALRDEVAQLQQQAGTLDRALAHFAESLRLLPSTRARNNLASALLAAGRRRDARALLERAVAEDPAYALPHFNLGLLHQMEGWMTEAVAEYRTAIRLRPDHAESHLALGSALAAGGAFDLAAAAYRGALRARPDWTVPMIELAWLLATSPESDQAARQEALAAAERAIGLVDTPSFAMLDVHAAALAAAGDYPRASIVATQAVAAARAARQPAMADQIEGRLQLYRQGRPFIQRQ